MIRKTLLTASVLAALTALPAQAGLTFDFQFIDTGTIGFNDASSGAVRRDALRDAGDLFGTLFGSYFSDSAEIVMDVTSSENSTSGLLASAGSYLESGCNNAGNCEITEIVKTKLQTGVDVNGSGINNADGSVDVNWGYAWTTDPDVDASVANEEFDFFAAIFHELTHALGFAGVIQEDGSSPSFVNKEYATFDTFLSDVSGTSVLDANFEIDQGRWDNAKYGGTNGLFFNGTNAVAANNGQLVEIYSPDPWEGGSSSSHLDTNIFTNDMMKHNRDYGPETRTYSAVDVGVLMDIGYTRNAVINQVSAPGSISLMLVGLLGGLFLRRRNS